MGDLDDGPEQKPLDETEVEQSILNLLPANHFDLAATGKRSVGIGQSDLPLRVQGGQDEMTRLARQVRRTRQFRVVDHEFRLLGLCRACHA